MINKLSNEQRRIFGHLGSLSLSDIIQLMGLTRRTVTLVLDRGDERGRLYFRDGRILHASAGPYEGEDGVIELLQWVDAEFSIEEGVETLPKTTIAGETEALLLSSLTRLDESSSRPAHTTRRRPSSVRRPLPRPRRRSAIQGRRALLVLASAALMLFFLGTWVLLVAPNAEAMVPWRPPLLADIPAAPTAGLFDSLDGPHEHNAWALLDLGIEGAALEVELESASGSGSRSASSLTPGRRATPAVVPTTQPVGRGSVTVVVRPWARVAIDGLEVGQTPLAKIELAEGRHTITLANDNVAGLVQDEITIVPGSTLLKRYNLDDVGYLRLVVSPWADVEIDGRSVGQTPMRPIRVPVGRHVIRFAHPELGATERAMIVESEQTYVVKISLPEDS